MLANDGALTLICADLDARPLFWTEADRRRHGYEPAVAAAAAGAMGLTLRWQFRRWAEFVPSLQAGEADAIWCGCAITAEREQSFLFSRPYAIFDEAVLVRRGAGVSSPSDLRGRQVGAIAGSTNMDLARGWGDCELVAFDGTSDDVFREMIDALRSGRIDAVVDDEPAFGGLSEDPELETAFVAATGNRWGAAMRPDARDLKRRLDAAIGAVVDSGELAAIWRAWFPRKPLPPLQGDAFGA
ncbi:MAG: ABC transporter substrate-binding protein [Gammaproteobacteria bacterium]